MVRLRRIAPDALAALFGVSGVLHLVRPSGFEALIPPFMPAPGAIVAVSGVAELMCALGLLRRERWAGRVSAALLVAVFPGNLWFALATSADPAAGSWLVVGSWLRLPLQVPMIWAALQAPANRTGLDRSGSRGPDS
ncbi:MAG: DoxX family protein [Chloroflexota bacterium]|nr:DoxX family protein [Chloroflexota bacterium]